MTQIESYDHIGHIEYPADIWLIHCVYTRLIYGLYIADMEKVSEKLSLKGNTSDHQINVSSTS